MRISDWSSDGCSSDLEYKREAFGMFNDMLARYKHDVVSTLARVRIQTEAEVQAVEEQRRRQAELLERRMPMQHEARSAERRVGKGCVSTCRYRWARCH